MTVAESQPKPRKLAEMKVAAWCTWRRDDGTLCGQLLFRGTVERFEGQLEFKCRRCRNVTIFQ